ncbi:efflux RND transporter periplasmic adaptor subunit [Arenicella xantha]|uniref:RND family efflux transporter MFP subunit n=1 Tax=Arenicella xantha TaxID=644221 RepID=A0A395JK24_9GAMM|nr:efflux RND transporter periplasmic adaptor subunit [Arenicella xantha]RBP51126.1 RND family efflux transporter MFP subunit [Arenicella xantha]
MTRENSEISENTVESNHKGGSEHRIGKRLVDRFKGKAKVVVPLTILLVTAMIIVFFLLNQPVSERRRGDLTPTLSVSVHDVVSSEFRVKIKSYGSIRPRTETSLFSQVSGQITYIDENLRQGSFFKKGDVLLEVDDRDYAYDVKISEANLASAQQVLSEELAQSKQAELDWQRLGNTTPPTDLVLRKPQLQAARSALASAEAAVAKAKLNLARTKVIAPYSGRVLEKLVDVGQFVNGSTQVARIFASDYLEVRLPIAGSDLKFIDLPETYHDAREVSQTISAEIFSSLSENAQPWLSKVVRSESAIDENSRQLNVVAQIDDPFGSQNKGRVQLKIGEYVTAEIQGKTLPNAIVVPYTAIYQDSYVYVVENGVVIRRAVTVLWKDETQAIIGSGLSAGDRLVTTALGQVASGTKVNIEGEAKSQGQRGAGRRTDKSASESNRPKRVKSSDSAGATND